MAAGNVQIDGGTAIGVLNRTLAIGPWWLACSVVTRETIGVAKLRGVREQAHPALVEADLFDQCQGILDARGEAGSQRAASNSDYQLTGRITCPKCGCKYVGTSASGKLRRYRYYICFTRARYGVKACDAPRIDADLLDQAIIEALIDFHGNTDLILEAISRERAMRDEGSEKERSALAGIGQEIRNVEASIDRYLNAFENGSLDER